MSEKIHDGSHFRKYLTHTPWYLMSSLITKAIGFFLLPIYTHYLSPEDFGILSNVESFGRMLPVFISLYMDAAFSRYYYQERTVSDENVQLLYSTHFWFLIFWGGALTSAIIFYAPYIFAGFIDVSFWPLFVVILTQLLNQMSVMVTLIWKANLLAKRLAILQLVFTLVGVAVSLYLLINIEMGWESRIYGLGTVAIIQAILLVVIALRLGWISFKFDKRILKRGLKYSVPLIPNVAAGWIAGFSDRFILAYYGRLDEAGLYSIAAQFAYLVYVMNDAVTQVQGPIAMSGLTDDAHEAKKKIARFVVNFLAMMVIVYFSVALFSKEILYLFTDSRYHEAYQLVIILGLLYIVSGVYRVFSQIISFHKKMWVISSAAILQAFINVVLNLLFIPMFGMYAAAISTLISLLLYTWWIVWWAQKIDPVNINIKSIVRIMTVLFSALAVHFFLDLIIEQSWLLFISKFILLCVIFVFVLDVEEVKPIKDKLLKRFY